MLPQNADPRPKRKRFKDNPYTCCRYNPYAVERHIGRRDDGKAGAINVSYRPCHGKQVREDAAQG